MADVLYVPPDNDDTLGTLIDAEGNILLQEVFDTCESGTSLSSGRVIILREDTADPDFDVEAIKIYDANRTLIATDTSLVIPDFWHLSPVARYGPNKFLVAQVDETQTNNTIVRVISDSGVVGPESWELAPANGFGGRATRIMGVSPDLTTLYYGPDGSTAAEIYRWDLVGDLELSSLYSPAGTTRLGDDLLVLSDGTIIVSWREVAAVAQWQLRGFDPSGTVLFAYNFDHTESPRLALSSDEQSVWSMAGTATQNLFRQTSITDGSVLTTFNLDNQIIDSAGPSDGCPLILFDSVLLSIFSNRNWQLLRFDAALREEETP